MIFITWNVNSIIARLSHIEELLTNYEPDILCMQETKITDEKFPRTFFSERGYEAQIYGEKSYNGVAVISKEPADNVVRGFAQEIGHGAKRLIACRFGDLHVLNLYIPNGQAVGSEKFLYKMEWLDALKKHIAHNYKQKDKLIICGDFNIAPEDIDLYKPEVYGGAIMASPQEREHLQAIKDWGLVDLFRKFHTEAGLYTWWDYQAGAFRRNAGFRIDHIWATPKVAEKCQGSLVAREMRQLDRPSDHAPLIAEFDL
jgi:exodeoxyribonuclease III